MQYLDTGWFKFVFTILASLVVLIPILSARKGRDMFIRRIPGLNAIEEAIGRATEMGRPILMVPGLSGIGPVTLQALEIFSHVTRTAAKFATPIRLCVSDGPVLTVAQEIIRDVYQTEGIPERYDPDSVRYVSDQQFAFAAGVSGMMLREKVAAAFFLGDFYAESLIFAETANSIGAIQVAGSTQPTQTPFFIASCDYVLIGEEFYAASAYLSREPVLVGSLIGQDRVKFLLVATIVVGVLISSFSNLKMTKQEFADGAWQPLEEERRMEPQDTVLRYFMEPRPAEQKIDRPLEPKPEAATSGGGK